MLCKQQQSKQLLVNKQPLLTAASQLVYLANKLAKKIYTKKCGASTDTPHTTH